MSEIEILRHRVGIGDARLIGPLLVIMSDRPGTPMPTALGVAEASSRAAVRGLVGSTTGSAPRREEIVATGAQGASRVTCRKMDAAISLDGRTNLDEAILSVLDCSPWVRGCRSSATRSGLS